MFSWKKGGIFAAGVAFGTAGIKILKSRDAKKVYAHCTAAALRAKDCVMDTVTKLQENAEDIYEEALIINEMREDDDFFQEVVIEDDTEDDLEDEIEDEIEADMEADHAASSNAASSNAAGCMEKKAAEEKEAEKKETEKKEAEADTLFFDRIDMYKKSKLEVARVYSFGREKPEEMLRMAACLEEKFSTSIARAVVDAAKKKGLVYKNLNAKTEKLTAHGLSAQVQGKRAVIGSNHFVFEEEKCKIPAGKEELFKELPGEYTRLYLALDGELAAVICITSKSGK